MISNNQLEMISWLGVPGVGSKTLDRLSSFVKHNYLSWNETWKYLDSLPARKVLTHQQLVRAREYSATKWSIQQLHEALLAQNITVIDTSHTLYPPLLAAINDAPRLLFVRGNVAALTELSKQPSIAVVGTRKLTPYGVAVTRKITQELVNDHQAIIISGGMYGVDAEAHAAALAVNGTTISVIASGLAKIGSYWQQLLCTQIEEHGGVVMSEFYPWNSAHKSHFPIRNRVVAGLSRAIVVTEAAAQSGSLITAQFGLEYGREICAVPGPITSEFSQGTKWLINQGATLVSSGAEVMATFVAQLPANSHNNRVSTSSTTAPQDQVVYYLKQVGNSTTSELATHLQVPIAKLLPWLSKLELQGQLIHYQNRWHLAS
jgi:DNA processing protein